MKGTIHWVSARARASTPRCGSTTGCSRSSSPDARARTSWSDLEPGLAGGPRRREGRAERSPADAAASRFQFERLGYFCVDPSTRAPGAPVFNRTVTLRDTWAKLAERDARAGRGARGRGRRQHRRPGKRPTEPLSLSTRWSARTDPEQRVRAERYRDRLGLAPPIRPRQLASSPRKGRRQLFEDAVAAGARPAAAGNWILNESTRELKDVKPGDLRFFGAQLGEVRAGR